MRLAHVGYVVPKMESALKRFLQESASVRIPPTFDPIQRVWVCLLVLDGGADIELVAPSTEGESPVRARLARGGGLDHLCYAVDDLSAALERERERGSIVVCEPCYAVAFNADVAFVHRRSGLVVELMAYRPAS